MAELVWERKYVAGVRSEPSRVVHPFATEELHGAAAEHPAASPPDRLILGDKAHVLPSLLPGLAGKVSLVYLDPPFETGGDFAFLATIPGAPVDAPRVSVPVYRDARGLDAWLAWFYDAAVLIHELLRDGGSLYVHLDAHVAHYAKVLLDEVFGPQSFQREIIWRIGWVSGFKSRARGWIRNHDTLLFFTKGPRPATFHKEYIAYPPGYTRRDGTPPRGLGRPIEDVWNASDLDRMDSIQIMSFSGEKVGYPTQKNEALVARIVRASSDPGDLVLDCFVGSGTTAVVARKLGRRFIASDLSPVAIHTTRKRLLALGSGVPWIIERVTPAPSRTPTAGVAPRREVASTPRLLHAEARVAGLDACVSITHFALPPDMLTGDALATASHWSQWIDEWCVDWDHRGGAFRPGVRVVRSERRSSLALDACHPYPLAGRHCALVRVYDVLGGVTSAALDVQAGDA